MSANSSITRRILGGAAGPALILAAALLGGAAAAQTPPQLVDVEPADGTTVTALDVVAAVLDMTRGEAAPLDTLGLRLDGQEISQSCDVMATRDLPPSHVEMRCAVADIAPGPHLAELRFRTDSGREMAYRWRFTSGE